MKMNRKLSLHLIKEKVNNENRLNHDPINEKMLKDMNLLKKKKR
jgi:hypothetical protein